MKVSPGLPQNQEGFLVDLVEGTQKGNLLSVVMEGYLLPALSSLCGNGGVFTTCFNFLDDRVVANFLSLSGLSVLSSEKPEASPSTEGFGGGFLSSGLSGGSLSVRGRVPTKSWE